MGEALIWGLFVFIVVFLINFLWIFKRGYENIKKQKKKKKLKLIFMKYLKKNLVEYLLLISQDRLLKMVYGIPLRIKLEDFILIHRIIKS